MQNGNGDLSATVAASRLEGIEAARTAISDVDGERGRLTIAVKGPLHYPEHPRALDLDREVTL